MKRNLRGWMLPLVAMFSFGGSPMALASEIQSINLSLEGSEYSDFFDFLYSYSTKNRLNIQWLGWYKVPNATKWFERSDRDSNFKINVHLLTEENGYLYFSSGFDEKSVDVIIDYGSKKDVWLTVVDDFKEQLEVKGWTSQMMPSGPK